MAYQRAGVGVFHVNGRWYVIANDCPHAGCPLGWAPSTTAGPALCSSREELRPAYARQVSPGGRDPTDSYQNSSRLVTVRATVIMCSVHDRYESAT